MEARRAIGARRLRAPPKPPADHDQSGLLVQRSRDPIAAGAGTPDRTIRISGQRRRGVGAVHSGTQQSDRVPGVVLDLQGRVAGARVVAVAVQDWRALGLCRPHRSRDRARARQARSAVEGDPAVVGGHAPGLRRPRADPKRRQGRPRKSRRRFFGSGAGAISAGTLASTMPPMSEFVPSGLIAPSSWPCSTAGTRTQRSIARTSRPSCPRLPASSAARSASSPST